MAGCVKPKQYKWKESNLALFGSKVEKDLKKEAASGEEAWHGAGTEIGLLIWRIEQFKVKAWPKEDYGNFYSGDSYIILNTYKEEGEDDLEYDLHFWIGKESTQDEYGAAAYKTVELDTYLNDAPIQHREVQGMESDLFKSYFEAVTYMKGGAKSGFKHVKPEEYKPRLLHFCGAKRKVKVTEVPLCKSRVSSGDVYILDLGKKIWQWNGDGANKDEKFQAAAYCQQLESDRCGRAKAAVIEESRVDELHEFWTSLTEDDEDDEEDAGPADKEPELFRLSDQSGKVEFKQMKKGKCVGTDFCTDDVFILDNKDSLFVWIGKGTSASEKKNAMSYAHEYLMKTDHPTICVSAMKEGKESKQFRAAICA